MGTLAPERGRRAAPQTWFLEQCRYVIKLQYSTCVMNLVIFRVTALVHHLFFRNQNQLTVCQAKELLSRQMQRCRECRNVHIWGAFGGGGGDACMGWDGCWEWCLGCIEGDVWREWWGMERERGTRSPQITEEEGRTTGKYLVVLKEGY